MCEICEKLKTDDKLLDNEKWAVFKDGTVIWKEHSGQVDCDTCILWIELKCRELFGKDCSYRYDFEKLKDHFHFYVEA